MLADVMTDKATVEIPSPVARHGRRAGGEVGQRDRGRRRADPARSRGRGQRQGRDRRCTREAAAAPAAATPAAAAPAAASTAARRAASQPSSPRARPRGTPTARSPRRVREPGDKPIASPAVRRRAWDLGIELQFVHGSGPAGRITHEDLDAYAAPRAAAAGGAAAARVRASATRTKRSRSSACAARSRRRCRRPSAASRTSPMSRKSTSPSWKPCARASTTARRAERGKLTLLPFLTRALVLAVRDFPQINARYDDEAGVVTRYGAVHLGIATQTDGGPDGAGAAPRRSARPVGLRGRDRAAGRGRAQRQGRRARNCPARPSPSPAWAPLGGIVTTPVINHPEVAIVGVNRIVDAADDPRRRGGAAADDEPVVARSTTAWSTACTRPSSCRRSAACSKCGRLFIELCRGPHISRWREHEHNRRRCWSSAAVPAATSPRSAPASSASPPSWSKARRWAARA